MSEPMTDLEITRACRIAIGHRTHIAAGRLIDSDTGIPTTYDPLHDGKQCLDLYIKLLTCGEHVAIENDQTGRHPILIFRNVVYEIWTVEAMRRAVVQCVAALAQERGE